MSPWHLPLIWKTHIETARVTDSAEWLNRLWHIWSPVDVIDRMKPGKAKKVEPGGRKKRKIGTGVKLDYYYI